MCFRPSFRNETLILKELPGSVVVRHGCLDSTSRTIPHLAAPFSDTTEAVAADEDNDYSLKILKEAGLKFRFGMFFLIFYNRKPVQQLASVCAW